MQKAIKKIIVIGPESTGKSTLCQALAKHYNTVWCKEYAREYLLHNGINYSYNDLLTIAKGQLALEKDAIVLSNKLLIVDTDMLVIKTWCEFVFNQCHNYILQQAALQTNCIYLLCNIDLPWTKDELREYPDVETREKLFFYNKEQVIESGFPWALVSGFGKSRLQCAVDAVESLLG